MNKRKILFAVIASLLPLLFFVIVELFLSIFDLFPQPPLFFKENEVIKINSNVGERYFNKKNIPVPNLYPQTFSSRKSDNTFRIICLGGSTTAGFPYEMTVPFPRQLRFILQKDYPEKKFEVINMGLSAISSFTVLDWLPDILEHDPDLIIMYMGHNEFYGAYGTGSTISFGHNVRIVRFVLTLQKLRIVQMLNALIQSFVPEPSAETRSTIMEKIIDDRFIATNSELREITRKNFSDNLDFILSACAENKTPVILCNLVCNLKDQTPLDTHTNQTADSTVALRYYQKGLDELNRGDSSDAYISFSEARDMDTVPFRANSEINSIIYNKAQEYGIHFIDMNKVFRALSPQGIPGKSLFCDHLHPNPVGYKIMANEFHQAIATAGLLLPVNPKREYVTTPELVTELDWEIGFVRIYTLQHSWPFANKTLDYSKYPPYINEVTAKAAKDFLFDHHVWGRAHSEMADYYEKSGALDKACAEYQAIVEMYPNKIEFYTKLIDCAKAIHAWSIVKNTCLKALNFSQDKGMFYYNLALAERMTGDMKQALLNIQKAIDAPELNRKQLAHFFYTYATFLIDTRQLSAARQLLLDLIKQVPEFKPAKELLQQLPKG